MVFPICELCLDVRVIHAYIRLPVDLTWTDRSHGTKRPLLASRF